MDSYSYFVGGLLNENLTPEAEQEKLNLCAADGWELVQALVKKFNRREYTFFYFRRKNTGDLAVQKPRFIFDFSS
jgi:hypothetical protein